MNPLPQNPALLFLQIPQGCHTGSKVSSPDLFKAPEEQHTGNDGCNPAHHRTRFTLPIPNQSTTVYASRPPDSAAIATS